MINGDMTPKNIDEYINSFPKDIKKLLISLRKAIQKAAPNAEEAISYQIPTFKLNGNLVHFAAYKNHIGFYPTSSGISAFQNELSEYEISKGTVRLPIDKPLPLSLISRIVRFRVAENLEKANGKRIASTKKSLRTCKNGHQYYKSSNCPTCPICEQERKPKDGFLSLLAAPARRALENKGITTAKKLSRFTEADILELHGIGPSSIPKLRKVLEMEGLSFKK